MPLKGRSADDLPLAAYSTGVDPATEPATDAVPVPPDVAAAPAAVAHAGADDDQRAGDEPATGPARPPIAELVRHPRTHVRDPRLLLSGVIAIGVVLLGASLLGGHGPGATAAAAASPGASAGPVFTLAPAGDATVEITGAVKGTFALTGVTGTGRPAGPSMDATWGDALGNVFALGGLVSAGTRATDAGFVLTWTVMVNGKAVTFTSKAGECTVGMAIKPATVSGSFTCHKLKSMDGKLVVGATGIYRT